VSVLSELVNSLIRDTQPALSVVLQKLSPNVIHDSPQAIKTICPSVAQIVLSKDFSYNQPKKGIRKKIM